MCVESSLESRMTSCEKYEPNSCPLDRGPTVRIRRPYSVCSHDHSEMMLAGRVESSPTNVTN